MKVKELGGTHSPLSNASMSKKVYTMSPNNRYPCPRSEHPGGRGVGVRVRDLLQKPHMLRCLDQKAELLDDDQPPGFNVTPRLEPVQIYAARQRTRVKSHDVCPRLFCFVHKCCDFTAEEVVDPEAYMRPHPDPPLGVTEAERGEGVSNRGCWVEGIGIVLLKMEL